MRTPIRAAALAGLASVARLPRVASLARLAVAASFFPIVLASGQGRSRRDEPRVAIYRAGGGGWRVDMPPEMEDALDRYNRDFEAWSADDYGDWLSEDDFTPRQTPWAVIGDFNGDGRADLAIAGRDERDAMVVFLISTGARRYRAIEVEREPYDDYDRRSVRPPRLRYMYPGRYVIDDPRLYYPREILVDQPAVQLTGGRRQGAVLYMMERNSIVPYYLSDRPAPPARRPLRPQLRPELRPPDGSTSSKLLRPSRGVRTADSVSASRSE